MNHFADLIDRILKGFLGIETDSREPSLICFCL